MVDSIEIIDDWGPEKIVIVSDQRVGMRGALVIDNTSRGMGKGGTRMALDVHVGEVARLARVMTWKWAANDLFFGGAKAGIRYDPDSADKEEAIRAFARALKNEVPFEYVLGLDMGMNANDAAVFQDEMGVRGAAVGLPACVGDVPHNELGVTGYGVAEAVASVLELDDKPLDGTKVAIQGFGAVGSAAAERIHQLGGSIIGISSASGALLDQHGLDIPHLLELRHLYADACVEHYGLPVHPLGAEVTAKCDVFVPAATQDAVRGEVAGGIQAGYVVEGANLPLDARALEILHARHTTVVPDFIANSGGIIAAAHIMEYSRSPFTASVETIFETTSQKVRHNVQSVVRKSRAARTEPHQTAREIAAARVREAMMALGRMPR